MGLMFIVNTILGPGVLKGILKFLKSRLSNVVKVVRVLAFFTNAICSVVLLSALKSEVTTDTIAITTGLSLAVSTLLYFMDSIEILSQLLQRIPPSFWRIYSWRSQNQVAHSDNAFSDQNNDNYVRMLDDEGEE